jgi:chain length determinant protein EpsF
MSFSQFLSILRARWLSGVVVLLLTVATAVTVSLLLPRKYTATAAVLVDVKSPDPIAGMVLAGMMTPGYMATQVDIITSERVARRVVRDLGLSQDAKLRGEWQADTQGRGTFEAWMADLLQKGLDVKPSRESNVIQVSYTAVDPELAARVANAFVQAYIGTSLELRVEPARQYNTFFDDRAKAQREALEQAQAKLSAYQQRNGITASDERLDVENARLQELSSQLVAIQALSAESSSRQAQAQSKADQLSDVVNHPLIGGLRADLSRQEARLQELNSRLGDNHPQVVEAKASIAELRTRIQTETQRVSGSVGVSATINRAREGEVRAALEAQRDKVLRLKQQRDELSVLQRDVEQAQRAYDAVSARATQSSLESQNSLTNISALNPATEPTRHSSPKLLLNTILALFVGGLLAVATALLRELMDRRVRGPQDVVQATDLPVLGVMLAPPRGGLFGRADPGLQQRRLLARVAGPKALTR